MAWSSLHGTALAVVGNTVENDRLDEMQLYNSIGTTIGGTAQGERQRDLG